MKKTEKLHIKLNYGSSVTSLPSDVLEFIDKAKKFDLKVLFLVASSEKYREGKFEQKIADELSCPVSDVENSVSFWNGTGVLSLDNGSDAPKTTEKKEKSEQTSVPKRAKVSELPQYTSAELNALLQRHSNAVELIDESQNILGKIFTASDIKVLMALVDYLGLDNDYILVLMHYAARNEIKSLRAIEKLAVSCVDEGFNDARVLQDALRDREEKHSFENKIKNVFGIGSRSFTSKEKKQVELWRNTYKYDIEVIEKAYDITVNATSKPSILYANAIIERWYAEGVRTLADVEGLLAKREESKAQENGSFNVDDFFSAALKNSYSDKE